MFDLKRFLVENKSALEEAQPEYNRTNQIKSLLRSNKTHHVVVQFDARKADGSSVGSSTIEIAPSQAMKLLSVFQSMP